MKVLDVLRKNGTLFLDGATGTSLIGLGLKAGERSEEWNITSPEKVESVHAAYYAAGADVVCSNTFGVNAFRYNEDEIEKLVFAAVENAKKAAEPFSREKPRFVALDVGPTGKMLAPFGDLTFEGAVDNFKKIIKAGAKAGADLVFIETFSDISETRAALIAAKETCDLPIFVSNAYGEDGNMLSGTTPEAAVCTLEALGADAIGCNCSFGPTALSAVAKRILEVANVPVIFKPNADMPVESDGKTVYGITPKEFASAVSKIAEAGASVVGGCCGTDPEYISETVKALSKVTHKAKKPAYRSVISSAFHTVEIGDKPVVIGERINPTGKKRLKEAVKNKEFSFILEEAVAQKKAGADILDVNVGVVGTDESEILSEAVFRLQSVVDTPLCIDTSDADALERALRLYSGKALVNSVSGKRESMEAVFPLVKKYGGAVVCLTLDENGIPDSVNGRVVIAKKIVAEAERYGIGKHDLIFDALTVAVSASKDAGVICLETLSALKKLGLNTVLGISNISFGLPLREKLNSTFFTLALARGLDAAIIDPTCYEMQSAYRSFLAIGGKDEDIKKYVEQIGSNEKSGAITPLTTNNAAIGSLKDAITAGLKDACAAITERALKDTAPLDIINSQIMPALDEVGMGFENKTVYLPQLLLSAECAKVAFDIIKKNMPRSSVEKKTVIVIATVKGDVHDIGKNIVKLLLENYGFPVIDLGKDVDDGVILDAVLKRRADILGLSALMTTTAAKMKDTVALVKEKAGFCRIMVGGAVVSEEYANAIGADYYAKDALSSVKFAESVEKSK